MGKSFVENTKNLTDDEVILLINSGEYEKLQIIIDRYLPLIVKTAKQYCAPSQVEDAVQDAIFALYSGVKNYDKQRSAFSTFASLCIKRSVISGVRKSAAQRNIPDGMLSSIEEIDVADITSPEDILIEKEDYQSFADTIRLELSSLEYRVLQLFLAGKTYTEIAVLLEMNEKSVDNALFRIRRKLKK